MRSNLQIKTIISLILAAAATIAWAFVGRALRPTWFGSVIAEPGYFFDVLVVSASGHSMNIWVQGVMPFLSFYSLAYGLWSALGGLLRARQEASVTRQWHAMITGPVAIGLSVAMIGTLAVVAATASYSGWSESLLSIVPDVVAFFLPLFALGHLVCVVISAAPPGVVPLLGALLCTVGTIATIALTVRWWSFVGPLYPAAIGIGLAGTGIFVWEACHWRETYLTRLPQRDIPVPRQHWLVMLGACIGVTLGQGTVFWDIRSRGFATDLPSFLLLLVVAFSILLVPVVLRAMRHHLYHN